MHSTFRLSNNIDEETVMIFFKSLANLIVYQNLDSNFTEIFTILKNNKYTIEKLMLEVLYYIIFMLINWSGVCFF